MPRWQMPRGPHLAVWRRVHESPHATVQMVLPKVIYLVITPLPLHATVQMVLPKVHTTHPPTDPPTHRPTHPTHPPTRPPQPPSHRPSIHTSTHRSPSHPPPSVPVQARHAYLEVGLTKPSPSRHDSSVAVLQSAAAARSSPVSEPMMARLRGAFCAGRGDAK